MRVNLAVRTTMVTTGHCAWEIRTGATPGRARLLELGIFMAAATASTYGLGYPQAIGITPTTPVDFICEDGEDVIAANVMLSALAWGTEPTIPTAFIRRIALPATVGTGVIWTFPKGIVIPVSSSIILWNLASNGAIDAYATLEV